MKRYPEYKDSGIEWIGEIPVEWEIKKTSWIFKDINSGTTPRSDDGEYYGGNIAWLNTGDLNDGRIFKTTKTVTEKAIKEHSALKIYENNSLVIAMYGATIGKLGITEIPLCTNQACCVMSKPVDTDVKFMFYNFLAIRTYLLSLAYGGGQPNISQTLIRSLKFPNPDLKEQQRITYYLDRKTEAIDNVIADKEKLIERLKEKHQAIISQAVTKGLKSNVPMKDSGIDWLGEIPKNWEVAKVGYYYEVQLGKMLQPTKNKVDDTLERYFCAANIQETGVSIEPIKKMWFSDNDKEIYKIKKGDLLVVEGGDAGLSAIYNHHQNGYIQNALHRVRSNERANNKYLHYWLKFLKNTGYMDLVCNKATIAHYTKQKFLTTPIVIPELKQQNEIVEYLDIKSTQVDIAITDITLQIEKLKEYRQAIISEAVTGKVAI